MQKIMENPGHTGNTLTAMMSGGVLAMINSTTGIFNSSPVIEHLNTEIFKALLLGIVGALGGLITKSAYGWAMATIRGRFGNRKKRRQPWR
jgi:hypothetical protein